MQETERKRGENGDLHLVANTGFVVLLCVVACGASRAVISCWSNLYPGRSILCGILGGSMGADVGLNCMRACTYIYKKCVCISGYPSASRRWRKCGLYAYARCDRWENRKIQILHFSLVSLMHACMFVLHCACAACVRACVRVRRGACGSTRLWPRPGALMMIDRHPEPPAVRE